MAQTGAERYLEEQLNDPDYRAAYEDASNTKVLSVRLPNDLAEEIEKRADQVDRSTSWYIKNALQVTLERLEQPIEVADGGPLDKLWEIADASGSAGSTYEISVTFALPPVGDPDLIAFDIQDAMRRVLEGVGRDVYTRIISLKPMQEDTRQASPA